MSYKNILLITYALAVVFIFTLINYLYNAIDSSNVGNISKEYFKFKAMEREEYLQDFLSPYFTTINSVAQNDSFKKFLSDKKEKEKIEEYFLNIKKSLPCLTQIRYINNDGNEIIRIHGTPVGLKKQDAVSKIIPQKQLQQKSDTPYVKKFLRLQKNEIGLSDINLNEEQGKITIPKQPTLRLGMIAYDQENIKKGIVVINICLRTLFKQINKTTLYYVHFIDQNGIYLNHHDTNYGLLGDKIYTVFDEFPDHAENILNNDNYYGEYFYSYKLNNFNNGQNIKMILELKFRQESQKREDTQNIFIIFAILYAIVLFPVIIYMAKLPDYLTKRLKDKEEIENKNIFINTLLKSLPIPMFYKDVQGKYFDVNKAFCDLFGIEKDDAVGKTVYDIANKELADDYKLHDDELIKNYDGKTQIYESRIKNPKTNEIKHIIFHKNVFFDRDGNIQGIIGAAVDITELKNIQNQLHKLNEELEEKVAYEVEKNIQKEIQLFESAKLASMGSMLGNIIHQWKQPLNIISSTASLVKIELEFKGSLSNKEIEQNMDTIVEKVQRLSDITDTFKDFLRERKVKRTVILQDVLENGLKISATVLKDKNIKLISDIYNLEPIQITTIPNELIEVIVNITNNAVDALEEKNILSKWVKIYLEKQNDQIMITIEDSAGGIKDEILPYIFDEYFTTKDEDKGTGLGLYMSKKIITESLKGDLKAQNGQFGAKFIISLPLEI